MPAPQNQPLLGGALILELERLVEGAGSAREVKTGGTEGSSGRADGGKI